MSRLHSEKSPQRFERLTIALALVPLTIGAVSMIGHLIGPVHINRFLYPFGIVAQRTALCFMATGIALLLLRNPAGAAWKRKLGRAMGAVVGFIGTLGLTQYFVGVYVAVTEADSGWAFVEFVDRTIGRLGPGEAINLACSGWALVVLDSRPRGRFNPSNSLAVTALSGTAFAFLVYLYGIEEFIPGEFLSVISWTLLAGVLGLSFGILFARPDRGLVSLFVSETPGGMMARRMLPISVLIPALLYLGLYAQFKDYLHLGFSLSLLTLSLAAIFIALLGQTASLLNSSDEELKTSLQMLRHSEASLKELSASLERQVAARTLELQQQTLRLRDLTAELTSAEQRERKRLAALLHDGLQQLLVAAKMLLSPGYEESTDGSEHERVQRASRLLDEAVRAARDLTRELRPPVLYESGLLDALRWLASEMKRLHRLQVVITSDGAATPMADDAKALLFECIRELLFNAVKHARTDSVSIQVRESADCLSITIQDKGCGFEVAEKINTHERGGFGLFSVRERLAAYAGSMEIDSKIGEGTRIELALPLWFARAKESAAGSFHTEGEATPAEGYRRPEGEDARVRVLIVDDHSVVREGLANTLARERRIAVVGQAADGIDGIETAALLEPDVVLMDVNMPRMNGIDATREIRRRWSEVRIVGLSVQDDEATARSMIEAGASAFMSKSGRAGDIISKILELAPKGERSRV